MVTYTSGAEYIQSKTSLRAKITAIDAIIDALMTTALKAAESDEIEEYWLNDGQTQIKTIYKGADAVMRSIRSYEQMKQYYIIQLNGRSVRLVDSKNFTGNG